MERRAEVLDAVERLLEASEFEVVDVDWLGGPKGSTVRVLLDKPGGLSVEDCARVSRALTDQFEAESLLSGPYVLEVSSPGIDRPLRKAIDFERFAGETVQVTTYEKVDGRSRFTGILAGYDADRDAVLVDMGEGDPIALPRAAIKKAQLKCDPWKGLRQEQPVRRERKAKRRKKKS